DAPLGHKRHFPAERYDLLRVRGPHFEGMPGARTIQNSDPDLAPFFAEVDFRAGDRAGVAGSSERDANVLFAVLKDAHHDRILCACKMQKEILARQFDSIDRDLAG